MGLDMYAHSFDPAKPFYAKSECEDYECEFGTPTSKWSGEYCGSRGG